MDAAEREHGIAATAAILGVDRLYREGLPPEASRSDDILAREGPVAINLSKVEPERFAGWEEARARWTELRRAASRLSDPVRRAHYEDQADAMLAMVDWQSRGGDHLPPDDFERRGAAMLGLARLGFTEEEWSAARREVAARLERAGCLRRGWSGDPGELREGVRRWEEARWLDASEALRRLDELLDEGRERVERLLFPLPNSPRMVTVPEHDVSYNAYCDYERGEMRVNFDQAYTLAELRYIVAHEAYPGHTTHLALREAAAAAGESAGDTLLVITDTPTSPVFEGIGDNGPVFCWEPDEDDRTQAALNTMRTMAACRAADALAAGRSADEVRATLLREAACEPTWVDHRMRFLGFPLRRPFIYAYAWGERLVLEAYGAVPHDRRTNFLLRLYRDAHSPRSLALLGKESSQHA